MGHREDIRAYLESLEVNGLAVDWGCGAKPVRRYVKGNAKWLCIDKNPQVNTTEINFQLHDITEDVITLYDDFDHAFCMEVLEHTTDPLAVLRNIYRNLKEGGVLHLSVPFLYPEHGDEDYLRLTSQGLRYFAEKVGFKEIEINEIEQGFIMKAIK